MSEFHVRVVQIEKLERHPNADSLSLADVEGYPVIFRTGDFNVGDLAVYVPIDAVMPAGNPHWAFLGDHLRIKAKRLRGVFSMGLLLPMVVLPSTGIPEEPTIYKVGDNVQEVLGIVKYEPPAEKAGGHGPGGSLGKSDSESDPGFIPIYTDIEGFRRYKHLITEGEEVVLTEKLHGANARYVFHEGRLWVGTHRRIIKESETSVWWRCARSLDLESKLSRAPGVVLYGEVFGDVQDLRYGAAKGEVYFRAFDAYSIEAGRYKDYDDYTALMDQLEIPMVPLLHRGPWSDDLRSLAQGTTTLRDVAGQPVQHVREGFVMRPVVERWDKHVGRVVLKLVGEDYLLRKGA